MGEEERIRIALFGSGQGSTASALYEYSHQQSALFSIQLMVSNNGHSGFIEKAKLWRIPYLIWDMKDASHLLTALANQRIDLLVLVGFLKKIPESVLQVWKGKILNLHPALLPYYGGKGMYGSHVHHAVFSCHERYSGVSVHFVNEAYDEGPLLHQVLYPLVHIQSPEEIQETIRTQEKLILPVIVERFCYFFQHHRSRKRNED